MATQLSFLRTFSATTKPLTVKSAATLFALDDIVTVLVVANPKKVGSAARERFDAYRSTQTVKEALSNGIRRDDLRYDLAHGFVRIDPPQFELALAA